MIIAQWLAKGNREITISRDQEVTTIGYHCTNNPPGYLNDSCEQFILNPAKTYSIKLFENIFQLIALD